VAFTPDGTKAYVANNGSGTVTPITVATGIPGTPIAVGANPHGVAIAL
jgi:YVTN family beta-propeller protein